MLHIYPIKYDIKLIAYQERINEIICLADRHAPKINSTVRVHLTKSTIASFVTQKCCYACCTLYARTLAPAFLWHHICVVGAHGARFTMLLNLLQPKIDLDVLNHAELRR